ncbi:hypothetical protein [Actinomadura opuntiae]|uniref:hypothetical protein n=1 Tax=Actinomadura sp. OS1-43 TaxID=604315 RepID=UPI00255A92B9|nr:hypothetical protein [Actinomadura sp. OS1-43]MDL4812846.1 hypothetical protein [Actinomadura sp. OS1-43]
MHLYRIGLAATLAAVAITAAGCNSKDTPKAAPSSASKTQSAAPKSSPAPTARTIVTRLADLYPLPNPTDNTGACAAKKGSTGKGCVQLITTDAVSVYEFGDAATAAHWTKEMRKLGDWRQVGRFVLAWTARDQKFTSKDARAKMVAAVRKMTAS